jgi:hypothetical protein
MGDPTSALNSTDRIGNEFLKLETRAVSQHTVALEVSEQIDSPRGRQSVRLTLRPGSRVQSVSTFSSASEASG